jgi:hypothetical protein
MNARTYETPAVIDYGTLLELTEGFAFRGVEDGGNKLTDAHHSGPIP